MLTVYGLFILAIICSLTSSYDDNIAKLRATALMTVGVAPLHKAMNPSYLVIRENAFPTLV